MVAVAGTWLIAQVLKRRGVELVGPLLVVQCLLIGSVLLASVIGRDSMRGLAAMLAVSAMACQFATLRIALPGVPSTAVMTGNLTQIVLSTLDTASRNQLAKAARSFVGFFLGCTAGALAVVWLHQWAWSLPVALAICSAITRRS
jgi:uncharacterized membrane protein YoaK (UPF0700 family)